MTAIDRSEFFDAIGAMEKKLLDQFNTGLGQVNAALIRLQEATHVALLEQERRNSTFATRELADRLAGSIDALGRRQGELETRAAEATRSLEGVTTDVDALKHASTDRALSYVRAAAGFLASLLAVLLTAVVTYVLTHAR